MKFSSSLKFNAVAEWWDEYIAYSTLKKHIFQLEKQYTTREGLVADLEAAGERAGLLGGRHSPSYGGGAHQYQTDKVFTKLLDKELDKIVKFYEDTETELLHDLEALESDITQKDAEGPTPLLSPYQDDEDDDDEDDDDEPNGTVKRQANASGHRMELSLSNLRNSISDYGDAEGLSPSPHPVGNSQTLDSPSLGRRVGPRRRALSQIIGDLIPARRGSSHSQSSAMGGLGPETIWSVKSNHGRDVRMLYKRRITTLYITATSLKAYVELNYTGFRKILKKYDKVLESSLQAPYLHEKVEAAYPFRQESKDRVSEMINRLTASYAKCVAHGDLANAQRHLKINQREQIVWERDTVWRQMISQERRGEIGDGQVKSIGAPETKGTKSVLFSIPTPFGPFRFRKRLALFLIALAVFIALIQNPVLERPEPSNCFAILIFCTILWATEAIPLFVTSIMVPFLLAVFRVVRSHDGKDTRLSTTEASKWIFSVMFSPTIMLLIGGFTIASALSKTNIDRVLITKVLSFAGTRPSTVLLSVMGVSCFASMWISNVAAPTLCFTLIKPILRTLPPQSAFAPCLVMAIALAANIGGQSSPISSPQNLIALQKMDPPLDWLGWFSVALPVSAISIVLIWALLLASYRPGKSFDGTQLEIKPIRPSKEKFTWKQYWVAFVCLVTIGLWCVEHTIESWIGDMGIIGIIPIVAFFSTGVLKKDDFEQFLWSIVFIAMGGSALGKAVEASHLLEVMDRVIRSMIEGLSLGTVILVLSVVVLIISTFISHTIASVLLVPIAAEVGASLPEPHPNLLVFITALICSTGMGMPVSGFPNQTAATQEDEMGRLYLTNIDFLKNGVPASIIATAVVSTVGFGLMKAIGLK